VPDSARLAAAWQELHQGDGAVLVGQEAER
jgi:hypothetical protein